ncbi:MAG: hydrogenase nickel incorporation protein HypB [Planctomycetes bacterium]|nr:hydrogenase nickel incorporation protein HypB [Planctomycetota bacterium]
MCGDDVRGAGGVRILGPATAGRGVLLGAHDHGGAAGDHAGHVHERGVIELEQRVLAKNDRLAERVRGVLLGKGILGLNLVSSPGSGKTSLLERTLRELDLRAAVLVGDLATDHDARRLQTTGAQAVQITTGNVCHLDAHMVLHGLERLDLGGLDVLFLENVGNLVCPASFDLGEDHRVVLTSVTEGEDKPTKYPTIFLGAELVLVTKTDLCEVLEVDTARIHAAVAEVAPAARVLDVSSRSGDGLAAWYEFVRAAAAAKRARSL